MADIEIASNIVSASVLSFAMNYESSIEASISSVSTVSILSNIEYSIAAQILALSDVLVLSNLEVGIAVNIVSVSSVSPAFSRDPAAQPDDAFPCEQTEYFRPRESAGKCDKQCLTNYKYVYGDDWEYDCDGETKSFFFQAGSDVSYADAQSNFLAGALAYQEELQANTC